MKNFSKTNQKLTHSFAYMLTCSLLACLPALAFEDCIITTNGSISDIRIQHNDVIDVFPLVTVMNEKNTIFVHPLKTGETKFSVIKNGKEKHLFDVKVEDKQTSVKYDEDFDVMTLDCPPDLYSEYFDYDDLDLPPSPTEDGIEIYRNIEEARQYSQYIDSLDVPPLLREAL